jgi:hypothetical protein
MEATSHVYCNVIRARSDTLVAVCDAELLGRVFRDKKSGVIIEVKESFYKGRKAKLEESINLMRSASIINMVGARVVEKAVECGIVDPVAVLVIGGVPHAQVVKM